MLVWFWMQPMLAIIFLLMFSNQLFSLSCLTSSSIFFFLVHMAISFVSYLTGAQLLIRLLMEMDHSQIVVKKAEYASQINISALILTRLLFSLLRCWGRMFVVAFLNSETMRLYSAKCWDHRINMLMCCNNNRPHRLHSLELNLALEFLFHKSIHSWKLCIVWCKSLSPAILVWCNFE